MKKIGIKLIQILQFKALQPFYLLLLKIILGLMNYGIGGGTFKNGEVKILKLVDKYIKHIKHPIIFDVGANIGQYLKDINSTVMTPSIIYNFEPQLAIFNQLKKNIPVNSIHQINPINIGLGIEKGVFEIYSEASDSAIDIQNSCSSLFPSNITNFLNKNFSKEKIYIDTIDNFCKENNIHHINFLKIDIEGNELNCLKGARKMLMTCNIDVIQIEHNRCAIASRVFLRDYWDMFSEKYILCRPLANNKGLYVIKNYDIYLENFTYINYVMVKKDIYKKYFI